MLHKFVGRKLFYLLPSSVFVNLFKFIHIPLQVSDNSILVVSASLIFSFSYDTEFIPESSTSFKSFIVHMIFTHVTRILQFSLIPSLNSPYFENSFSCNSL
jgi:hypothetical protein